MAAIAERGRLVVGVDQNTSPFGYRNPTSGQLEGFDIDVAREIARRIFGDPDRIDPLVVDASQRESALQSGEVDVVVRTYSITCERKQVVDFSTVYFVANQKILARKGSGIDSAAALAGKRVCAVSGTTSLSALFGTATRADVVRRAHVDRLPGDAAAGAGRRDQHRRRRAVRAAKTGSDPRSRWCQHGRRALRHRSQEGERRPGPIRQRRPRTDAIDGTWQRLYERWLPDLGPLPDPPTARYQD